MYRNYKSEGEVEDDEMNSDPIEALSTTVEVIGKSVANMILEEAIQMKDQFIKQSTKEEQSEWEEWWLENLRQ